YAFLGQTLLAAAPATPTEAQACSYTSADLGQSEEVQITSEIQDLAEGLGYSPVRIYQYVSNEVTFEPYYGSLKGAMGTLVSKAGNATDQASLLIALLRASNIPARYVKGTAQFSEDPRILRWVGAKDYYAAYVILSTGNIPADYELTDGIHYVALYHVWVEACVPYGDYRGMAVDLTGHRWVPLDPSFKDKVYQVGIATNVTFDYTNYLATRTNTLPHERYGDQVEASIKTQPPYYSNNTLADVPYTGRLVPRQVDILPASLPYEVVAFNAWDTGLTAETAVLPDGHRYKLKVDVANSDGTALAPSAVLSMPQTVLQRVTLSFQGATAGDQTALNAWRTNPDMSAPLPCTINVVPVLRLEGTNNTVGTTPLGLCTPTNQLTLGITLADAATTENPTGCVVSLGTFCGVRYTNIQAADLHALQGYAFQASDRLLTERAAKLLASVRAIPAPNTNLEETEGEFLHLAGLKYMRYITDAFKQVGGFTGESGLSGNHLGLTSSRSKISYVFEEPFAVYRSGFLVDVPGGLSRSVNLSTGGWDWEAFRLTGHTASAYESYLWQENARLDAVSTVRGIQYAREASIEVLTLTSANWAAEKPKLTSNAPGLNYDAAQVTSIETDYITPGYTVTMPRSLIQYDNWKGAVFVAEKYDVTDPDNPQGYGTFAINQSAGGYTTEPPDIFYFDNPPTLDTGWIMEGPAPLAPPPDVPDTTPSV
ncbi:MAG TPA: transglutaminase-like domain-containing protein, partial [Candidatus Methylomirabilis sp.]|nr:transglutaminase-like domain-containing protein [Candidatus Methylomirabilis sp.]